MALKSTGFFAAILSLAVVAGAGSAQAAIISGHLDPLFGGSSPLSGYYFTGVETFTVDNSCLSQTGFVAAQGCDMNFEGATIDFYNEDPTISGATELGTANFPGDSTTFEDSILGMYVQGGDVIAVQSRVTGSPEVTLNGVPYTLDIQFGRTDLTTKSGVVGENVPPFTSLRNLSPDDQTTLFVEDASCDGNVGGLQSHCPASAPAAVTLRTFTSGTVPEPAIWTMLLVGFGALGAALRDRRKGLAAV